MSYIVDTMLKVMDVLHGLTGNWGLSIIGLTLLVRLIILPFTIMQGRSTQRMAMIQPELDKMQKKYKDDPERLNLEIMDIYRRNKVNPLSLIHILTPQSRLVPEKTTLSERASIRQPLIEGRVLRGGIGREAVCTNQARCSLVIVRCICNPPCLLSRFLLKKAILIYIDCVYL